MYMILKKCFVPLRVLCPFKYQGHSTDMATSEVTLLEAIAYKWVQLNELLILSKILNKKKFILNPGCQPMPA